MSSSKILSTEINGNTLYKCIYFVDSSMPYLCPTTKKTKTRYTECNKRGIHYGYVFVHFLADMH